MSYVAIHSEGGLLPLDLLERIGREELPGQKAADFGLPKGTRLTDEIGVAWSDAVNQWDIFKRHRARVPDGETGTTVTRERWMLPLLMQSLGYGDLTFQPSGAQIEGKLYPISHRAGKGEEGPPVHIDGFRADLDRRPPTGHRRLSPHALVQEYLNREEKHLWGIVTNGVYLRVLRNTSLTSRPTYLEFDLESILEGNRYNEFVLFYRLCHRTRLPQEGEEPNKCFLETYYQEAIEQGGRVREKLRDGVEEALKIFGSGFLQHPANEELRERLISGKLHIEGYHQQLLRLVYRLLFLMVAEERHMIVPEGAEADRFQGIYDRHYSITRLRELAERIIEKSTYGDLWLGLKKTFGLFSENGAGNPLRIPPLNGDLFGPHAMGDLEGTRLFNHDLIAAIRRLSLFEDNRVRRRVNYAALDVEELGSVYESLLDFQPAVEQTPEGLIFVFRTGTERKSTGSYYTRPELVRELIESALVPVMTERLAKATTKEEKEKAILSLKVCDPASGSGHFLLAAARRLGRELAKVKTGEEEPTPKEFHLAVRDVISHCIYGVDVNPLAVDLCKLSLWLEGHWTGKPLSFLDHHIKCGNSLIGVFDPEVLKEGIPDDAFKPVTGDDKKAASAIKKRNKKECTAQQRTFAFGATVLDKLEGYAEQLHQLSEIAEDSPADVKRKAELYKKVHESPESHRAHRAANLWTAAFFAPLTEADVSTVPTTEPLRQFIETGTAYGPMIGVADSLALKHKFFHWFLEFPEVFANGGFDVVLGNPPWERIKLQEEEFFATRDREIARLPNKAARQKLIDQLPDKNPALAQEFAEAKHAAEAESKFVRTGGRYPLTAVGDINTYALFAELFRCLLTLKGSAGVLLPTGIATDHATKGFFGDLVQKEQISKLLGFENEAFIFPAVHHSFKFCAITMTGAQCRTENIDFAFFCRHFDDVRDPIRHFTLSSNDLTLLNPNSSTCPVFRTNADAEISKSIYQRVPVLVNERTGENPWGIKFLAMFHMANDSHLFQTAPGEGLVPLYEAKMMYHFDHRYGTYDGATQAQLNAGTLPEPSEDQKADPTLRVKPRYWVAADAVDMRLEQWNHDRTELLWRWERGWLLGFRDVTSAVVERTTIFSLLPRVGIGHKIPLAFLDDVSNMTRVACFLASMNSLVLDYITRQKIGGISLSYFILKQLPVIDPAAYATAEIEFIGPRVLELVYPAWDIKAFSDDLWRDSEESLRQLIRQQWEENKAVTGGHEFNPPDWAEIPEDGIPLPPFKWDEDRRAHIRAELDAYYALLYGLNRKQLRYILDPADLTRKELEDILDPWEEVTDPLDDAAYRERMAKSDFPGETFRVLKEKEIRLHGEYRTRRLVLEAYERLVQSKGGLDREPDPDQLQSGERNGQKTSVS